MVKIQGKMKLPKCKPDFLCELFGVEPCQALFTPVIPLAFVCAQEFLSSLKRAINRTRFSLGSSWIPVATGCERFYLEVVVVGNDDTSSHHLLNAFSGPGV